MTARRGAWPHQRMGTGEFRNSPGGAICSLPLGQAEGSFVPDGGTRFVLARPPSDESLGYFRASLRDWGSRWVLMRSKRLVASERFPIEPRYGFHR